MMQHLFLQQSYRDCWEAYEKSLKNHTYIKWDYVILTASNEAQAESYRTQIDIRVQGGYLPTYTRYVVLPDPDGKRVGSGGATLNVLKYLAEDLGGSADSFTGKRVLVIHSGGDSKRVPQYSACGKIFSPVPRELPDGRTSTLFDEFMIGMAGVAGRLKEGMLVLSGDVLLLFNPLQIDFTFSGAAALSIKEPVSVGKNHGVFLNNGKNYVGRFLHKQSEQQLRACGAVNQNDCVDLDTGAVALGTELMRALLGLISTNNVIDAEKFARFVNEKVRLSFYGDFLYPLAEDATLENYYNEAGEVEVNEELLALRKEIWEAISGFDMRLISLTPAEFIHFGTTAELLKLVTCDVEEYKFLGWSKQVGSTVNSGNYAVHNSLIDDGALIGSGAYIENSYLGTETRVGNGSIVSGIALVEEKHTIPSGVVLHGLQLEDGRYVVRIYDVKSNPKDLCDKIMSGTILQVVGEETALWDAAIYPICSTMEEAVKCALITYRMMKGVASVEEKEKWLSGEKISLCESFNRADLEGITCWNAALREKIAVCKMLLNLRCGKSWQKAVSVFGIKGMNEKQKAQLCELAEKADFSLAIRIYYALMQDAKEQGKNYEAYEDACFGTIRKAVYESGKEHVRYREHFSLKKDAAHVELPVRVNWGGGWTDTPPHCLEQGGTVINAAVKLNGILPVQVTVRKIKELKIEVASEDVGAFGELQTLEEIRDCYNPYDAFSLHKAALLACGVIPMDTQKQDCGLQQDCTDSENPAAESLQDILKRLGGGLYLSTQVIGIPKGSGLGTSSILAGACVKAIFEIMGEEVTEDALYDIVLCMEQIMSTGGGWQDQVGGLTPGIKYITSEPGIQQHIQVQKVCIKETVKEELQNRFALIYTGQRRLARNLLREVVGHYVGGREESLDALFQMQRVAALMRFELEKGNIDGLASLFNMHWELSKQLDEGSTNTCIEQIFRACEDLIAGRFIAGAGGGGFLQVILKRGVSKEQLRTRLREVFQDSGVDIWESEFLW